MACVPRRLPKWVVSQTMVKVGLMHFLLVSMVTGHGLGMRCGLGSLVRISELNSAIAFLRIKHAIALFSSEMRTKLPSPHLIPEFEP